MAAVKNSQTVDDGRLKIHILNTRLWSSFEIIASVNLKKTEIISSQHIIYINIYIYITLLK